MKKFKTIIRDWRRGWSDADLHSLMEKHRQSQKKEFGFIIELSKGEMTAMRKNGIVLSCKMESDQKKEEALTELQKNYDRLLNSHCELAEATKKLAEATQKTIRALESRLNELTCPK